MDNFPKEKIIEPELISPEEDTKDNFSFKSFMKHMELINPSHAARIKNNTMSMLSVIMPIVGAKFAEWEQEHYEEQKPEPKELNTKEK